MAFISRSMSPTERRYAQIEKEALASTWACERLSDYLVGLQFHIYTDHKPLVPLFSSKHLEELPLRVQRFRLLMMRLHLTISHINHLKIFFARHGIPETLISDNGPQYASQEFKEFAREYEFRHTTSSPYFPQGNGEAEQAVGTVLKKSGDPYKALLAYRSTPLQMGYSPSQLLMGRVLRSTVPTTRAQRDRKVPDLSEVRARDKRNKARQKRKHDTHRGARELPQLQPGDQVWVPQRQSEGEVQREVAPQSYTVESEGDTFRRNRRDLIRLPDSETGANHSEPDEPVQSAHSNDSNNSHDDTRTTDSIA